MEKQMRLTLAKNLARAVQNAKPFRDGAVECDKFLEWCDGYQVQIIVLSAQIRYIKLCFKTPTLKLMLLTDIKFDVVPTPVLKLTLDFLTVLLDHNLCRLFYLQLTF
jgi:hypothetical protein